MKKIFNLMLFAALLLVGACSDKETDEPDPVVKLEFPSEETFKKEIQNNLWEIVDWRYETEDGIDFPSDLWRMCQYPELHNLFYHN